MVGLTIPPCLLSRAIDEGLRAHDTVALLGWVAALFAVGVVNAGLAISRHRTMTKVRLDAAFRTTRAVVRHSTILGATLPRRVTAGEVVTIGMADVQTMARSLTATGPGVGAVVAYAVVAMLLLSISPLLATIILVGVPLLAIAIGPLLSRIQRIGGSYREQQGALTARLVDIVTGLRVLGGLGGKDTYLARYRTQSQALRATGYRVGAMTSWLDSLGTGLPALFLAVVTWVAARLAAEGSISIGELVAVYGYVAMLVVPVASFIESGSDLARAVVSARRVTRFLRMTPDQADGPGSVDAPPPGCALFDPASGIEVRPGVLTAIAGSRLADSVALIDRLGGFCDSGATWGGVPLSGIVLGQLRERVLVADNDAELFAGTVRETVAGRVDARDAAVWAAVHAAVADDIVEALPAGLDSVVLSHGGNLSGGQRQRLRLARAICAAPEILLAVEPTSAVDAHTEALLVARLRTARAGRTTVVTTTSPLILDQADAVIYLVDGRQVATGRHRYLMRAEPGYRALVSREVEVEVEAR
ncbi:ABC transporter ATP-binding protein [Rugosimonospora acidiphila]